MFLHGFDHCHALADSPAHRFFAPDVLAGFRGFDRHQGMPVRRGANVDDVKILAGDQFAEIGVTGDAVFFRSGFVHPLGEVGFVNVAQGQQFSGHLQVAGADAAAADDAAGELLRRRCLTSQPENMPRYDLDRSVGGDCFKRCAT